MTQISFRMRIGSMLVLGVIGIGQTVRAQDRPMEVQGPAPAGLQLRLVEPAPVGDSLDTLILGIDPETARDRLESRLVRVIGQVDEMYDLTPEQEKKLDLAGRGDIKRYFDRVAVLRQELDRLRQSDEGLGVPLALNDILSLRQEFQRNPFGDDSLFAKALKRMLTPEQRARYRDRNRVASYQTRVHWVLMPLRRELGLSRDQHLRLRELIVKETRPLEKYGELDEDAILLQTSRLPEARLRPVFDDAQWRRLGKRFEQARRMENVLVEGGYLPRAGK